MKKYFITLTCLLFSICHQVQAENKLVVIANHQVMENVMTPKEIKDIYFLKRKTWKNNTKIVVVNRDSNTDIRQHFEKKVLGVSRNNYSLYLKRQHYSGKKLPVIQKSDNATLSFIENVPGSLGYIKETDLPSHSQVKILGRF